MSAELGPQAGPGVVGSAPEWSTRHPGWPAVLGPLVVRAGTVVLRPPRLSDGPVWSRIRMRDRAHLENWEPTAPGSWDELNGTFAWLSYCWSMRAHARRGESLPFVIVVDGELVGQITVGNIVRGGLRSAWIGYWVAAHRVRLGVASAAVALVVDHVFGAAGLHRLEATVQPENIASVRVLTRLGFREEGLFRRYLSVRGIWRDHLCFALTAEEVVGGLVRKLVTEGRARVP